MAESHTYPALEKWQNGSAEWLDIDRYTGGDVLIELDDGSVAYGTRRENGSWVQFVGGVALRLCGPETVDDDDNVIGHLTKPREPRRFCAVSDDIAIHFMAH